ncbi:hypothetical protein JST56_06425 [Candidatus Dependentiae bacterium]|jgi:hypothetical protein|nr:hypothetical protein [Candidatus Dependentiae bacterium]
MNTKFLSVLFAGIIVSNAPIECMHEPEKLNTNNKNKRSRSYYENTPSEPDGELKYRRLEGEFDSADQLENIDSKKVDDPLETKLINEPLFNQLIKEGQTLLLSLSQTQRMIQVQTIDSQTEYTIFSQDGTRFTLGSHSYIYLNTFEPGMELYFPYACNHPLTIDEVEELAKPALLVCPLCRAPQTEQQTLVIPKLELPVCDLQKIPYEFLQFITIKPPLQYQREIFEQCTNLLMPSSEEIIRYMNQIEDAARIEQEDLQTKLLALEHKKREDEKIKQAHKQLITRPLKKIIEKSNKCDDYYKRIDYLQKFKKLYNELLSTSPEVIDYKGLIQAALLSKHGSQNFLITIFVDLKNLPTQQVFFNLQDHPDLWLDIAASPYATPADTKLLIHFGLNPQTISQ